MPENTLYQPPFTLSWLEKDRYLVTSSTLQYLDQIYIKNGYKKNSLYYDFANNLMLGNINSIYEKQSFNNKFGPQIKRYIYYYSLIEENFDKKEKSINFDNKSINLINLAGINYIFSVYPIKNSNFKLLTKRKFNDYQVFIYKNQASLGRIQFFDHYYLTQTFDDFEKLINRDKLDFVILQKEKDWSLDKSDKVKAKYEILNNKDDFLKIKTKTNKNTFLVLADTYYPGWQAYLNGKKVEILRANLLFWAIYLPKGTHEIVFRYYPDSFEFGLKVTLITGFITILILFILMKLIKLKII